MRSGPTLLLVTTVACASSPRARTPPAVEGPTTPAVERQRNDTAGVDRIVVVRPKLLECPVLPRYPTFVSRQGIQGRVMLHVVIDTLGFPESTSVRVVSSPHDSLSATAAEAVLYCRFSPARVHGKAVRFLIEVPMDFKRP
jgi:TonB family protein